MEITLETLKTELQKLVTNKDLSELYANPHISNFKINQIMENEWNPDDIQTILSWTAFKNLKQKNIARFEPHWKNGSRGNPINHRDLVYEYNVGSDFLYKGRCVHPLDYLLCLAFERKSQTNDCIFSDDEMKNALEEYIETEKEVRIIQKNQRKLEDLFSLGFIKQLNFRNLLNILGALFTFVFYSIALVKGIMFIATKFEESKLLLFFLAAFYLYATKWLLETIINKEEFLYDHIRYNTRTGSSQPLAFKVSSILSLVYSLFIGLSFSLWQNYGEKMMVSDTTNIYDWCLYGLDNLIRAVIFDFAEIYSLNISDIQHQNNILSATIVFLFRTTMGISFISILYIAYTSKKNNAYE